ncbi:hypothetical protein Tco_0696879 [Tanacetum coccineum]
MCLIRGGFDRISEVGLSDYPTDRDDDDEEEVESSEDDADDEEEDREVDRLLAISTPPPSLLTSYSTPLPQIPSSTPTTVSSPITYITSTYYLLVLLIHLDYRSLLFPWLRAESPSTSHPLPLPLPIVLPHTRASMAIMRAIAPSTYILTPRSEVPPSGILPLLPIPLPTSSPPFLLPFIDYRADILKVTLLPQKRLCITPGPRYKVRKCSPAPTARPTGGFKAYYDFVGTLDAEIRHDPDREIGYGITDVWVDLDEITEEIPMTDVAELGQRMTNFVMTIRQDTYEIYRRLDDAQDDRSLMSGQLNLLHRDRRAHARTARLMESEDSIIYPMIDNDLHDLSFVEAEFPTIVINDDFSPQDTLQNKSQVSTPVNDEIDFRISFDESDDKDYTIICDKNSFSYKMISVNNLKTDSENDYEKFMPSIPSPEPTISYFDDLYFFKVENEFPVIVYNDAQTSKSDLLTEPILNPQHIDEFNLKDETSFVLM